MSATDETVRAMTYREALREAMSEAMRADTRVFLLGEDVGAYGGSFGVSRGMLDEFGPERIRDTPLSESAFVGAAIGAAMGGWRPIVEIMTVNFSLLALDQIVNNAATIPHMSGGQLQVPLVLRMTTGAGRQLAAQHSHSLEGWFAHVPGLKVLAPATVADARWMLGPALADPNPVIVFEHGSLYNREAPMPDEAEAEAARDITRAAVRRSGTDVSLVAYGQSVWVALEAAEALAAEDIDAEVLDLRVLRPLDADAVLASVARTHRLVAVDEMWRTGSFAAEICALVAERALYDLDAPPARVCTAELPIPYAAHLERAALPSPERVADAAREAMGRG